MIIILRNIKTLATIGINQEERIIPQLLVITVEVKFDPTRTITFDSIEETINYSLVKKHIIDFTLHSRFYLLETFTAMLVKSILEKFPLVDVVRGEVQKPQALPEGDAVVVVYEERKINKGTPFTTGKTGK